MSETTRVVAPVVILAEAMLLVMDFNFGLSVLKDLFDYLLIGSAYRLA